MRLFLVALGLCWFAPLVEAPLRGGEPEFRSLFNGQDLTGWDGDPAMWRVENGYIEGGDGGPAKSSFLILRDGEQDAMVGDFHLRLEFWIESSNSGIQYRSTRRHGWSVAGAQAEVNSSWHSTGFLFPQNKSGPRGEVGQSVINDRGTARVVGQVVDTGWLYKVQHNAPSTWCRYDIVARGNHYTHFVNGYPTLEYIEQDEATADRKRRVDEGVIALQIHSADAFRVRYRNIAIKEWKAPRFADAVRLYDEPSQLADWTQGAKLTGWSAQEVERDARGRFKQFPALVCDGSGAATEPLRLTKEHGPSFVFRCQIKSDAWPVSEGSPFKPADGWRLLEVTVQEGKTSKIELDGESRTDVPAPIAGGKLALPSHLAAEYRNLTLLPIGR